MTTVDMLWILLDQLEPLSVDVNIAQNVLVGTLITQLSALLSPKEAIELRAMG
jgi:hypothetical protein